MVKRRASSLDALFDVANEAMEVSRTSGSAADAPQLLPIHSIRPDPLQARRVLPPAVRAGFVAGQLDAPAALAAWQALAEDDAVERELLQSQVITLAVSIRQQELVNPVTVCPDGRGGYLLETGERRWWAHWWLVSVEKLPAFEVIRAQVVPAASPERQAAENLQGSPLTAVQTACQIARLWLYLSGPKDSDHMVAILGDEVVVDDLVGYVLYRSAIELGREDTYGKWDAIVEIMGRGKRQLQRQLKILELADGALGWADRARLTEGQLRPLVSVAGETNPERQFRIVQLVARYELPGNEVERLVKEPDLDAAEARIRRQKGVESPAEASPRAYRRPSSIMVQRLRSAWRFAARREKEGLTVSELVSEIMAAKQPDLIAQELEDLTEMLLLLRKELAGEVRKVSTE